MASLLIRHVDPVLHAQLKARAAAHHRSLEDEARMLLQSGLARPDTPGGADLLALAAVLFGPAQGVHLDLAVRDAAQDRPPPTSPPCLRTHDPARHQRHR